MARTPRTPRIQASGKRWAHGPRLSTGLLDTCTPPRTHAAATPQKRGARCSRAAPCQEARF